ncbi:MAG: AsmA-like C-terminal region-containing protein [Kiritimatiellae bacterium]|nr:AsmA-like C-terminal region-containing protein [Kiritimatiellia bacterium]
MNSPAKLRFKRRPHAGTAVALALAVLMLCFDRFGLPGSWLTPLWRGERSPLQLRVRRLRLGPFSGLRAAGVSAHLSLPAGKIRVQAEEFRLRPRWADWLRGRTGAIEGGLLRGQVVWEPPNPELLPVRLDELQLRLTRPHDQPLHMEASARWNQTLVRFDAVVTGALPTRLHTASAAQHPAPAAGSPDHRRWMNPPIPQGSGVLVLSAIASATALTDARLEFRGEGTDLHWAGRGWQHWRINGRFDAEGLCLADFHLSADGDELHIRGRWPGQRRPPEFAVTAQMSPAAIRAAPWPEAWTAILRRWNVEALEPIHASVTVGPRPDGSVGLHTVHIERGTFSVLGIPVRQVRADLCTDNTIWRLRRLLAVVGEHGDGGPLALEAEYEPATRRYCVRADAAFDPSVILPVLPADLAIQVGAYRSLGPPPRLRIEARGQLDEPPSTELSGEICAEEFSWNGAYLSRAAAQLQLQAGVLRLEDVILSRPDGHLVGRIEQDLQRRRVRVAARGVFPIPVLARLGGPRPHLFASQFRFGGTARVAALGQVDYGQQDDNWGELHIEADHIGYGWLDLDQVVLDAELAGRDVQIPRLSAKTVGGVLRGSAHLRLPDAADIPAAYALEMAGTDLDFAELLRALTDRNAQTQRGRLSASLSLAGRIGRGQGRTATGQGHIRIRRGQLLDIPVFGGLSQYLSSLVPGLGFVSQGDFRASFQIRDGYVETERAELRGEILSLDGVGRYYFDRRLQFRVEARLLRGGAVADLVRMLTSPVTRLLEFDLRGTLDQPEWAPRNLPGL